MAEKLRACSAQDLCTPTQREREREKRENFREIQGLNLVGTFMYLIRKFV